MHETVLSTDFGSNSSCQWKAVFLQVAYLDWAMSTIYREVFMRHGSLVKGRIRSLSMSAVIFIPVISSILFLSLDGTFGQNKMEAQQKISKQSKIQTACSNKLLQTRGGYLQKPNAIRKVQSYSPVANHNLII